ncbi:MAG TPA: helix-turn-helix domain-containing protein [Vicinamibacterales bacterium]|nr:helix-turn-helix domain-containing protein [Vicinamibacterales bacterium]
MASRIRAARLARGWTLRDLGAKVAVSIARLSAIENARQPLDVDLLVALGRALDVGIDRLLPCGRGPNFCVSRHSGGRYLPMRLVNHTDETLTEYHNRLRPLADAVTGKYIEPFDIEVWPVEDARMRFISHHHEEFLFVVSGSLECLVKAPDELRREELSAGDCIHFWSYLPHCIRSTSAAPARSIHVLCSLDEPADSELADVSTGPVFLMDGVHRTLSQVVGARLQALRRRRGMQVAELARLIGVNARRVVAIERGQKPVSVDLLLEICHRLRKPLEYFLAGTLDVRPYYELRRGLDLRQAGPSAGQSNSHWPCCGSAGRVPLTTLPGRRMTPTLLRLDSCDGRRPLRHPGQEFLYILKGAVRVVTRPGSQDEVTILSAGDTCFLDASVPHTFQQTQVTPFQPGYAEVLAVSWRPEWET